jgi:hypothetical protein
MVDIPSVFWGVVLMMSALYFAGNELLTLVLKEGHMSSLSQVFK